MNFKKIAKSLQVSSKVDYCEGQISNQLLIEVTSTKPNKESEFIRHK